MPSLEAMQANKETLRVDVGGSEPVTVSYRPNALTQDGWERIRKNPPNFTWDQDRAFISNQAPAFVLEVVAYWDLKWRESDADTIPITAEGLAKVPTPILQAIQREIQADMVPNSRRSETLPNG